MKPPADAADFQGNLSNEPDKKMGVNTPRCV